MAHIKLTKAKNFNFEPFVVELENSDTGEIVTYRYKIRKLGGKAAMKVQLLQAEFARDKKRDEIIGSAMLQQIVELTSPETESETVIDLLDLFDLVEGDQLTQLVMALIDTATSSSLTMDNQQGSEQTAPQQLQPQQSEQGQM